MHHHCHVENVVARKLDSRLYQKFRLNRVRKTVTSSSSLMYKCGSDV